MFVVHPTACFDPILPPCGSAAAAAPAPVGADRPPAAPAPSSPPRETQRLGWCRGASAKASTFKKRTANDALEVLRARIRVFRNRNSTAGLAHEHSPSPRFFPPSLLLLLLLPPLPACVRPHNNKQTANTTYLRMPMAYAYGFILYGHEFLICLVFSIRTRARTSTYSSISSSIIIIFVLSELTSD